MPLMVKDLMQDLEKGDRTEEHIKDKIVNKRNVISQNPFLAWGATTSVGYFEAMQQQMQQTASPTIYYGNLTSAI